MKDGLYGFSSSFDQKYNSVSSQVDGMEIFVDPGYDLNDKKYSEPRYQIIGLPNFPTDQKTLDITLEDFRYYCKGDWNIRLKK